VSETKVLTSSTGDGVSDDTALINKMLSTYAGQDVVIFFPSGCYIVTDTIFIPAGTKLVGEGWSQIVASGAKFQDIKNPHVMVQVGNRGDTGIVEIQDFLFTATGDTAGVVLMEWNLAQSTQGSAAMWGECMSRYIYLPLYIRVTF
jgi:hypothetical protein